MVAAGPPEAPPAKDAAEAPRELETLLAWYAESNELLLSALREAGPERECWTWWAVGVSPANAWGVARRRVHEVLAHTYDAQLAAGAVQPMPADLAIDGVAEFLDTCNSTPAGLAARGPRPSTTTPPRAAPGSSRWTAPAPGPHPSRTTPRPPPSATGTAEQLLLFVW
ncbi:maleylpyruvate isomerase N-terminal domain-containing protein [Streptomyces sp. NBC_01551]|nr:maleylpyruvate isomerase N-terminal domain-containing protein [Streptomyces sp. NBC_01551]